MSRLRSDDLSTACDLAFALRVEIERLRALVDEVDLELADAVADVLGDERLGLPLAEIARRLHRRESDIRAVLRRDARFAARGHTRGRRWLAVAREPRERPSERMGRNPTAHPDSRATSALNRPEIAAERSEELAP